MRLVDAQQLSKHKYVGGVYDGAVDMGYISAVNILAYKWGWNDALDSVAKFAQVDAVEVVRCKDCIHWYREYGENKCLEFADIPLEPNDFCSHGERRKDER